MNILRLTVAALFLAASSVAVADKTDIIYMDNGDRITGEILELRRGRLRVDSVSMGVVTVRWVDIDHIESNKVIQAEDSRGNRYLGRVPKSPEPGTLTILSDSGTETIQRREVVRLDTINANQTFWQNLDNTLNVGFTYTQASEVLQWNVAASTEYRTPKYLAELSFDSMITNNNKNETKNLTRRGDFTARYFRFRPNRFFWYGSAGVETNDELGIDNRLIASGGIGRNILQTDRTEFTASLGLAGNRESSIGTPSNGDDKEWNAEGVVQIDWSFFKLYTPKTEANLQVQYYAGLTDTSRQRSNINLRLKQEFVKDLYWALRIYSSFDNKPPSGAQAKQDFGVVTSLEYEF